jgi:D-sedoheptulose 7-phosphate isomerase
MSKKLLNKYLNHITELISNLKKDKILKLKNLILEIKRKKSKIIIFGNGGSISTANHFSVDLTKNAKIKCISISNDNFITCFANDYGFQNWMKKSIEYYADKKDLIIFLSVSGESKNILNAARYAIKRKIKCFSLTGHKKINSLNKICKNNIWINSMSYNAVEILHSIILLNIVDLIIGKNIYNSKR